MASDPANFRLKTKDGEIPYALMEGPTITVDEETIKGREVYLIRAVDLEAFFLESMPSIFVLNSLVVLPQRRSMPGNDILFTRSINFEPFSNEKPGDPFSQDTAAAAGTYNDCYRATIEYESGKLQSERDEEDPISFLDHSVNVGAEFLEIPPRKTSRQSAGGVAANTNKAQPFIKLVPMIEHSFRWEFVLNPNWSAIHAKLGHVNSATESLFNNAEAETVLFMGVSGSQKFIWTGTNTQSQPWQLDFQFKQKRVQENGKVYGWNHVWDPNLQEWVKPLRNGVDPLHESVANFNDLFLSAVVNA